MLFKSLLTGQICFGSSVFFISISPTSPSRFSSQIHGSGTISPLKSMPALLLCHPLKRATPASLCLIQTVHFVGLLSLLLLLPRFPEFQNQIHPLSANINIPASAKTSSQFPQADLITSASQYCPVPFDDFTGSTGQVFREPFVVRCAS